MNDVGLSVETRSVAAQVRYVNAEWKGREDIPRIGSKETRRANTSNQDIRVHDVRAAHAAGLKSLDRNGYTLAKLTPGVPDFRDEASVEKLYYPQIQDLLKRETGADHAFVYGHLVRTEKPIDFNDG